MKKYHLVCCFYVLSSYLCACCAQSFQGVIDSLQLEYRAAEDQLYQVDLLNEIAYNYRRISPDSVLMYADRAIALAKSKSYKEGLAYGYKNKGIGYYKAGVSADTIVYYYELAISYADEIDDYYTQAACYNNIGLIKSFGLAYNEAASYFLKGIEIFDENIPEENRLKALMLGNIGTSYHRGGDNKRGIFYYEQALAMADRLGEKSIPSIFVDELARARMEEGDVEGALEDIISLMPLHEEIGDYESKGETLLTLSEVKMKMGRYREAIEHAQEALVITKEYGFPRMRSLALIHTARGLKEVKELDAAIDNVNAALEIEAVGLSFALQAGAVGLLGDIYAEQGEYLKAYENAKRYNQLITQDQDANKQRISDELEVKYQNEEQLSQIARLKKEQEDQKKKNYASIALAFVFLIISTVMFYAVRQKNKATAALNEKNRALQMAEESLHEKNQELERYIESNMQLENFAHLASHDLREPMRNIVSFSQLLTRSGKSKLNEKELEYLEFIRQGTRRIEGLVQDLLDYSTITHSPLNLRSFSFAELLEEVQTDIGSSLQEKQGKITVKEIPEEIIADRSRMYQLFQNLFTNALRYSRSEIPPEIIVEALECPICYHIKVSDNGIGIAPDFHEQVFILFKTLENKSVTNRSGIGLATCKKVVEDHQGKIWVESVVGQGSTFHFTVGKTLV